MVIRILKKRLPGDTEYELCWGWLYSGWVWTYEAGTE
jgi:hypothetical protein